MDFINRFAILRAHEYNVYTIEGMREGRKKEKAGRCRVAEDAVWITSVVACKRGRKEPRARLEGRERERETEGYERRGTGG